MMKLLYWFKFTYRMRRMVIITFDSCGFQEVKIYEN